MIEEETVRSLSGALKRSPDVGGYLKRADAWRRLGRPARALADLRRAGKLEPLRAEIWAQEGRVHFDQGRYAASVRSLSRAIEMQPSAELLELRASVFLLVNRLRAALRDLDAALALSPGSVHLRVRRVRTLGRLGKDAEAAAGLAALRADGQEPWAAWAEGALACRAGRYAQACALFEAAAVGARASGQAALADKALYYLQAARVLASPGAWERTREQTRLHFVGLGMRHPWQIPAEALPALARSQIIFNNFSDPEVAEFLALFPGRVEDIVFRLGGHLDKCVRKVMGSLDTHARACFVTRGSPIVFGSLVHRLDALCRERAAESRALPAITTSDILLDNLSDSLGGASPGLQILGTFWPTRLRWRANPSLPIVLYSGYMVETLPQREYPRDHGCFLYGPGDALETVQKPVRLGELSELRKTLHQATVYFIPPAGAKAGAGGAGSGPEVLIAGLGPDAPYQATLETLAALHACDTLFIDSRLEAGARASGFFAPEGRLRAFEAADADAAGRILEEAARSRVGVVPAGHPGLFSEAAALVGRLGALGARCRLMAALSPVDVFLSRKPHFLGLDCAAIAALRYSDTVAPPYPLDPHNPALFCFDAQPEAADFGKFCAALAKVYPKRQPCFFLPPSCAGAAERFPLAELPARQAQARPGWFLAIDGEQGAAPEAALRPAPAGAVRGSPQADLGGPAGELWRAVTDWIRRLL